MKYTAVICDAICNDKSHIMVGVILYPGHMIFSLKIQMKMLYIFNNHMTLHIFENSSEENAAQMKGNS